MKAALEAHLRLQTFLPVRTHEAKLREVEETKLTNARKVVVMRGQTFQSIRECADRLRVSNNTIYREAQFLEASTGTQNASGKSTRRA